MPDFRETLWFKIGGLEAEAATQLPIEDRYLDDGSLTEDDIQQFSIRTPATTPSITPPITPSKPRTTR